MITLENYGFGLEKALGTNPVEIDNDNIMLNPTFHHWETLLLRVIDTDSADGVLGPYCNYGEAKTLVRQCKEHGRAHRNGHSSEKVLCVVHPFFLSLTDFATLEKSRYKAEYLAYLDTLVETLQLAKSAGMETVLFETPQNYAMATSLLAEQDLVSRVLFTRPQEGSIIRKDSEKWLFAKELIFAGCYNEYCLAGAIGQFMERGFPKEKLSVVKELVLDAPYMRDIVGIMMNPSSIVPTRFEMYTNHKGHKVYFKEPAILSAGELF